MALVGKSGFLAINGVTLPATQWSIRANNELEDISNAEIGRAHV